MTTFVVDQDSWLTVLRRYLSPMLQWIALSILAFRLAIPRGARR